MDSRRARRPPDPSEGFNGIGRAERRRMVKRWKESGSGLSLREWARQNAQVGDAAQGWLEHKKVSS